MNFNVYVEDNLANRLDRLAKRQGKKRNAIIREALEDWTIKHLPATWPDEVLEYTGSQDSIVFESYRDELLPPKDPAV
ncbi:MAG: ribbon-helix-helix domain-containing protein [Thermosynechococcaceae cyanobacterium]